MKVPLTVVMTRIFLILITFSSIVAQGQKSNVIKNFKQVCIGVNFSPDYNFRTLKNNSGSPSSDLVIKSRNVREIAKFGYTAGVNVFFNCTKHIGFETGIQYSNKGYKTKNQNLIFETPNPNLPTKSKFLYSYEYLGIPSKAKFTTGEGKIHFLSSIGFMTNFLLRAKQSNILEYSDGKTDKKQSTTPDFKKVDISPMISVGLDYKISDKFYFIAEPTFRYGIIKTKDAPVIEHLWNSGINLGIYHKIR